MTSSSPNEQAHQNSKDIAVIGVQVDAIDQKLDRVIDDHESRIRALEKFRNYAAGIVAVCAAGATAALNGVTKLWNVLTTT